MFRPSVKGTHQLQMTMRLFDDTRTRIYINTDIAEGSKVRTQGCRCGRAFE